MERRLVILANKGKKCSTSFSEPTLLSYFSSGVGQGEDLSHGPSCSLFREVTKDRLSRCSTAAKGNGNTDFATALTRASESLFLPHFLRK